MALKSTVFKASLNVADMDRHIYDDYNLTIARHPSETDERMMLRVLAYALHSHELLEFGKGISTEDEPDLWLRSLSGEIDIWIDLGTPTDRRLRKACGRSKEVLLYCYGGRAASIWWNKNRDQLARLRNLRIYEIDEEATLALAALASANMALQCTVQDGEIMVSTATGEQVLVTPRLLN
jgi:uncharacterized protein YaeQ